MSTCCWSFTSFTMTCIADLRGFISSVNEMDWETSIIAISQRTNYYQKLMVSVLLTSGSRRTSLTIICFRNTLFLATGKQSDGTGRQGRCCPLNAKHAKLWFCGSNREVLSLVTNSIQINMSLLPFYVCALTIMECERQMHDGWTDRWIMALCEILWYYKCSEYFATKKDFTYFNNSSFFTLQFQK